MRGALAWLSFPTLLGLFLGLTGLGLAAGVDWTRLAVGLTVANFFTLVAVEQLLPRDPKISLFRDRQSVNDAAHGLSRQLLGRPLADTLEVLIVVGSAHELRELGYAGIWPEAWPLLPQLLAALLVWSFGDYWTHRALHTFDALWWFHAVHHDTPQMHVLKSGRIHFGEEVFGNVLKPIPLLLLGAPPEIVLWMELWTVYDGNLVHSNVDQRFPSWAHYFLPTMQLHYVHHSADRRLQDSNYSGSTPIWDLVFGTYHHPDRHPVGAMGLADAYVPRGFGAQLAFPFRAQWRPPGVGEARRALEP